RYAMFGRDVDGGCPLHDSDGRCGLQKHCGEEVLPSVCRYYPRSPRVFPFLSCALSNGCEGVLETMFAQKNPMQFVETELTFYMPEPKFFENKFEELYKKTCAFCLKILQNRMISFSDRLIFLGHCCKELEKAFSSKNKDDIYACLHECEKIKIGSKYLSDFDAEFNFGFQITEYFTKRSENLAVYGTLALENIKTRDQYACAATRLEFVFDNYELLFEQMMVNHMFYTGFPFYDRNGNVYDSYISLCGAYLLLRFVLSGCVNSDSTTDYFVDVAAAIFRLIENSNFCESVIKILKSSNFFPFSPGFAS
ncbi:MAG: flagellin lysine-N-methylase, partial [Clostridia bacterium]